MCKPSSHEKLIPSWIHPMGIMLIPFTFFVQTLTGLLSCEIIELNVPHVYHTVWNALPHVLQHQTKPWQMQLTLPGEQGQGQGEDALLDVVRQGGVLSLWVHTDRHLDTSLQRMVSDFTSPYYPGITFVRYLFKARYHADAMDLSWKVEAYVGLDTDDLLLYHADDVSPVSTEASYSVLELIARAYYHHGSEWSHTPYSLIPALYHTWEHALLKELNG